MQNLRNIWVIILILITVLIIGGGIYWWQGSIKYQRNEEYCSGFDYKNCPEECELGPSCPICMDIGCHSKEFYKRMK
ncbi:hypothetical protein KAU19_05825 [Candidatus Parcubacteria bacterium]|nr:hypothetical protein [Candidatus Parcubacteria bacterium]